MLLLELQVILLLKLSWKLGVHEEVLELVCIIIRDDRAKKNWANERVCVVIT